MITYVRERESLQAYDNKKKVFYGSYALKAIKPTRPVPKASIFHGLVLHSTGGYGKFIVQTGPPFATIFSSKMTEEFTNKLIRNVPFSGKQADYEKWAKRFLSYAQMKKVKQILLGKEKPPSITEILEMQVKKNKLIF